MKEVGAFKNLRGEDMEKTDELKALVADSDNIVFFGGAGVSTESGIPPTSNRIYRKTG